MQIINRKWLISRTLFLILILVTPLIQVCLIKGADRYKIGPNYEEKFSYIGKKIYTEKEPLDFLFLGTSQIRDSINARVIQDRLGFKFKQKNISVENFGHNDLGYDLEYLILKDAIKQRGVKVVFLGISGKFQNQFHRVSRFLWNPFEDPSAALYAEQILESFPSIAKFLFTPYQYIDNGKWDRSLGSAIIQAGYSEGSSPDKSVPFKNLVPRPKFHKLQDLSLTPTSEKFLARGTFTEFQQVYLRKIIDLAKKNNIKLYFLTYPTLAKDYDVTKVDVLVFPGKPEDVPYLGIPETILFATDSRDEMKQYFWNPLHSNANGNMQYSLSILPALTEIYESTLR